MANMKRSIFVPARQLRDLISDSGMTHRAIAKIAGCDPSMVCHMSRGGRGSLFTTNAIADAITSKDPSLELRACLWVIACGFAPTRLKYAAIADRINAMMQIGVKGDA